MGYLPENAPPGTFNANPVSAAAGIATLKAIEDGIHIARANRNGEILRNRLNGVISNHAVDWVVYGDFSGVKFLPESGPMEQSLEAIAVGTYDYRRLKAPDPALRDAFRATMQLEGVDLNGLTGLTASVHTEEDLDHVVDRIRSHPGPIEAPGPDWGLGHGLECAFVRRIGAFGFLSLRILRDAAKANLNPANPLVYWYAAKADISACPIGSAFYPTKSPIASPQVKPWSGRAPW